MQVGDLVTLRDIPRTRQHRTHHYFGKMGIIVEWDDDEEASSVGPCGWVKWPFNFDWDIEYEEDLELISGSG